MTRNNNPDMSAAAVVVFNSNYEAAVKLVTSDTVNEERLNELVSQMADALQDICDYALDRIVSNSTDLKSRLSSMFSNSIAFDYTPSQDLKIQLRPYDAVQQGGEISRQSVQSFFIFWLGHIHCRVNNYGGKSLSSEEHSIAGRLALLVSHLEFHSN